MKVAYTFITTIGYIPCMEILISVIRCEKHDDGSYSHEYFENVK